MYQHLRRRFRAAPQGNVTIDSRKPRTTHGFTIVELLVVIVVIGILAAITIVAYTGISSKATVASLTSDLDNSSKQLKMYYVDHGAYPQGLDGSNCPTGPTDTKYCLKPSPGTTYAYSSLVPSTFHLTGTKSTTIYSMTDSSQPAVATTTTGSPTGSACPSGFIPVPGSGTYGTNDFCVMKYEAKDAGSSVPVSTAAGTPWVSISQTTAITNSANVANCTGCHLITEAEWMTIAQNVLSVGTNWSGSTVGTGCIFRGNVGTVDACGYDGADPESGTGRNAKASLTLTNGEVIWDLAGNVWEWTSGTVQSPTVQPGITGTGGNWREWTAVTNPGTISPNPSASATGITGASGWNSGNGIGVIYSNTEETGLRGFIRGFHWTTGAAAGVLTLYLNYAPSYTNTYIGFRVASP